MSRVYVVTPPPAIVSLAEAKAHLRVTVEADDTLIGTFLAAAQGHIDGPGGWLGRSVGLQTLELRQDAFDGCITLPCGPIVSVSSVKYDDANGAEQTVDAADYYFAGNIIERTIGTSWPTVFRQRESVRVRYQAGYSTIPAPIKAAVLIMTGIFYSHAKRDAQLRRETVDGVGSREWDMSGTFDVAADRTVSALLTPYRAFSV